MIFLSFATSSLELYYWINFGISHLRNRVEQISQRFLWWSCKSFWFVLKFLLLVKLIQKKAKTNVSNSNPCLILMLMILVKLVVSKTLEKEFVCDDEGFLFNRYLKIRSNTSRYVQIHPETFRYDQMQLD